MQRASHLLGTMAEFLTGCADSIEAVLWELPCRLRRVSRLSIRARWFGYAVKLANQRCLSGVGRTPQEGRSYPPPPQSDCAQQSRARSLFQLGALVVALEQFARGIGTT